MESLSKNKIKWIRSLQLKKNRDTEDVFLVEGEKMVLELVASHNELIEYICTTESESNLHPASYLIDEQTMKELSSLKTPNKYIAVVKKPKFSPKIDRFILAIDGVQDPGNLGTIIRTADWFGVDKIICSNETVDLFNSKVIQSSMGSLFHIPVEYCVLSDYLRDTNLPIYGALLEGTNIYSLKLENHGILVVGNEGNGISSGIKSLIQRPIHIPGAGNTESLNVSIATGILLSEFYRMT